MEDKLKVIGGIIILIIIVALCCGNGTIKNMNKDTIEITVVDKQIKNYKDDSKYLIFTDKEVFEITDSWVQGRFNSSDCFSKISKDKKYKLTVVGYRIPILSWYRNIINIQEVK